MKEDMSFDTPQKQKESEYWHAKSLEISCTFLPGECPLLNHINVSYQKHFAPVKAAIKENEKHEENLQVIKPLNGVDNSKFQPIIRRLDNIKVAITPYQMTPLHKVTNQVLQQMQSFNEYNEQVNLNGPTAVDVNHSKGNILGHLRSDGNLIEDSIENDINDMDKLEEIFNKLLAAGKINKQFLIQKLMSAE